MAARECPQADQFVLVLGEFPSDPADRWLAGLGDIPVLYEVREDLDPFVHRCGLAHDVSLCVVVPLYLFLPFFGFIFDHSINLNCRSC